jgi:hypothetical protein
MKRKDFIISILNDSAHGETTPLKGLIYYLRDDCNISVERIVHIARKHFSIPVSVSLATLDTILPELS